MIRNTKSTGVDSTAISTTPTHEAKDVRAILQRDGIEAVKSMFANTEPYVCGDDDKEPKSKHKRTAPPQHSETDEEAVIQRFVYDGRIYHMLSGDTIWVPIDRKSVESQLSELEIKNVPDLINRIQRDRYVSYVGSYAGKMRGLHKERDLRYLITSEPAIIQPAEGEWPTLRAVIEAVMGDCPKVGDLQVTIFLLWLKVAYEALVAGVRMPGQALVLAGPRGCGKSLLIDLIVMVLGGRRGHPHKYITGGTSFNGELLGREVLVSDDDSGSTDIRTRRGVGAAYKNLLFAGEVPIEAKFATPLSCSPFWRLVIAVNDEPECLLVLPPLSTDVADKITLIQCVKRGMPMPSMTPEQRKLFFDTLTSEVPALLFDLTRMEIPDNLRDDRCAVTFFHHPDLLAALAESSPETALLHLIDEALPMSRMSPGFIRPWEGTAAQLRQELFSYCAIKKDVERVSFNVSVTGSYLSRLAISGSRVERMRLLDGIQRWRVHPAVSAKERLAEFIAKRAAETVTAAEIERY